MDVEKLLTEVTYKFSRSSGAGGQNVNKVETRVQLLFHIALSEGLTEEQKTILIPKLSKKLSNEGFLILTSDATRSQLKNKEKVTTKFLELITNTLEPVKKRKPTTIPEAVKKERLEAKKKQAEKKENRKFKF